MKVIIETDQPCIVLVLLPRRGEPLKRAARRVIEANGEAISDTERPGVRKASANRELLRLAAGK